MYYCTYLVYSNIQKKNDNKQSQHQAKHNEVLGDVVLCRGCGSEDTYKCKITDVIICKECGYQD